MTDTRRIKAFWFVSASLAALLVLLAAAPAAAGREDESGYGFFRTVEGTSNLTTLEEGEPLEIEPNYPVMVGDRIWVTHGARLELVLPDRSLVRAMGGTDLYLERLALAADGDPGDPTALRLLTGEIQFVVREAARDLDPPRIATAGATVYLQDRGVYRISADEDGWTEVVVREGFAEVETDRGSSVVRAGEEARLDGAGYGRASIASAGREDSLEIWAAELDGYSVAGDSRRYVDERLHYEAAPLDRHGSWIGVEGRYAWRPRVANHWRPYSNGWWASSPSGLTWVSYEPWGWVTSHYGFWDYSPAFGWVWYPGSFYSPAWVYWYWGPTHVAWIPAGYYANFYGPRWGFNFRFGVYGWAGGSWGYWDYWTFCPTRYFGHRTYNAYWRSGRDLGRFGTLHAVPRGVITTDTRAIGRQHWGKPAEIYDALGSDLAARSRNARPMEKLVDITEFVARRPELSPEARGAVLSDRPGARGGEPGGGAVGRSLENRPWVAEPPRARSERLGRVGSGGSGRIEDDRPGSRFVGGPLPRLGSTPTPGAPSGLGRRLGDEDRGDVRGGSGGSGGGAVGRGVDSRIPPPATGGRLPIGRVEGGGDARTPRDIRVDLPPSPRATAPRRVGDSPPSFRTLEQRPPVVRRVLDGIRSRLGDGSSGSSGSSGSASGDGASSRGSGSVDRGSSSSGQSRGSSVSRPAPQRPPSSSARDGGSGRSSSGSSARSGSSSRGSKSTGSRSAAKPRPRSKPDN